mmetsp:Transcript_11333/g.41471  ORF Transcript_11333/g.41471 Transcript_11333/m.41471 type:complete len:955 (+) Transcript_11333:136-3000(+)
MATSSMRGLQNFVMDIRNCQNKEEERERVDKELANIRTKFKSEKGLSVYEKKKYVWKMLYIYMLGYDVDFGHMEAVGLISGQKYSEKQVGYMVTTVLLNENHDFLRLVINTVRNDIIGRNETFQCLALSAVANIGGKEFAEAVAADVQKLLLSSTSRPMVRKKAALCLLRLYRKNPEIVNVEGWADRMAMLLEERDVGVLTGVMSLLLSIVASTPEGYEGVVPKCIRILERLTSLRDVPQEYTYYGIPSPWLQVKTLRVLQYFGLPEDPSDRKTLMEVLPRILANSNSVDNVNKNNAVHAVLFECINLVVHLEAQGEMMTQCIGLLGKFIAAREPNIRYLGLENMGRLSLIAEMLENIKKHQDQIISSLKDNDISIRRRALDLLFAMCDESNARVIVDELLEYLTNADFAIREELALKIAILAEKYAPDLHWYVDSTINLIERAGEFVSDDIWFRVVQIVTNHDELQQYAVKKCVTALQNGSSHETMIKVAGYIIGEFGYLLEAEPGYSATELYNLVEEKFPSVSQTTKCLLLSTYAKNVMHSQTVDPEHKERVLQALQRFNRYAEQEIQQRAIEYMTLIQSGNLAGVMEQMPNFPDRESALIKRIEEREAQTEDRSVIAKKKSVSTENGADNGYMGSVQSEAPPVADMMGSVSEPAPVPASQPDPTDLLGGLMGDVVPAQAPAATAAAVDPFGGDLLGGTPGAGTGQPVQPIGSVEQWFKKLCAADSGILYEDPHLQIGVKMQFQKAQGRMILYMGNKEDMPLEQTSAVVSPTLSLRVQAGQVPTSFPGKKQVQWTIDVQCQEAFTTPPTCTISYSYVGQPVEFTVQLPCVLSKFIAPSPISDPNAFFGAWKNLVAPPQKLQELVKDVPMMDIGTVKTQFGSMGLGVCEGLDPNPSNIVAASNVCVASGVDTLVMLRLEIDPNTKTQFRLTVACQESQASAALMELILRQLKP